MNFFNKIYHTLKLRHFCKDYNMITNNTKNRQLDYIRHNFRNNMYSINQNKEVQVNFY